MDQADHVQDATYRSDEHLDPTGQQDPLALEIRSALLKLGSPSFLRETGV